MCVSGRTARIYVMVSRDCETYIHQHIVLHIYIYVYFLYVCDYIGVSYNVVWNAIATDTFYLFSLVHICHVNVAVFLPHALSPH